MLGDNNAKKSTLVFNTPKDLIPCSQKLTTGPVGKRPLGRP